MLYQLIRKILFLLPPETAHGFSLKTLKICHRLGLLKLFPIKTQAKPRTIVGIEFPNPVGLAAGLDKNGEYIDALASLGFGFIEVGTVTPRPQVGNPKPRLFRLVKERALINRMGFNNKGVDYLIEQVKQSKYKGVLGINIGKNFDTPNDKAKEDYLTAMYKVYELASYIVINISSPNTQNLRDLQHGESLKDLLISLKKVQTELTQQHGKYVPLIVKIAPDLTDEEIIEIALILVECEIDGVAATNTTIVRDGIEDPLAKEKGGLSGKPLLIKSNYVIERLQKTLRGRLPIIGIGGIESYEDVKTKMTKGAHLVQLYTGLIYQGPGLVRKILKKI